METDYNVVVRLLETRLMDALETDTDNPVYEDHQTQIIRNLLASIEIAKRIESKERGVSEWQG